MDKPKEIIKQFLRTLWQKKYQYFIEVMALCALFGTVNFFNTATLAGANISFNYSEASQGLSPNKTRFNAYEIVSDEVMQNAIERVGLQGYITSSDLAGSLRVSPDRTGNVSGSSDFISTSYNVSINTKNLDIRNRKTLDLMQSVCESYREFFLRNYGDNQTVLKEKLEVTSDCEPFLRLQEIEVRASQLVRYLNARLDENKSYVDSANKDAQTNNFTTLAKKINNIVDYDIPNVMAFVVENSVAKDADGLTAVLAYKNKIDDLARQKDMAYYDADKDGISLYEKSMTSVVMIPTTDELSEFYMSRTKTAMDTMARSADSALSEATNYQSDIVDTNYIIEKMRSGATSEEYLADAQEMINRLENGINELSENLFVLDKAYIKYKSQNYITFTYNSATFIQRFQIKKTLIEAMAALMLGTGFAHFRRMRNGRKERRTREKV